ncbi:oligosaccharide flippase family protein [Anoxybacillus geothermalis]|nr:oligosaccharide flippase family protein [Anoxybacillus geothermalis]
MKVKLLNLVLRGSGLFGKFLLTFFLARVLTPSELGTFGLINSTMSYSLYLLGLDFYTYACRSMAQSDSYSWPNMLRDQLVLYGLSYVATLPLLSLLFLYNILPSELALCFFILLVLEHLSQECVRLLIVIKRPLAAGVLLFIRSGLWCYILIFVCLIGFDRLDLNFVLLFWLFSDTITLILAIWLFRKIDWKNLSSHIDWEWIKKGLRIAALFLMGTLAIRGLFTFDRYFVKTVAGSEVLGVYTLYMGITSSIQVFIDAVVFNFQYPLLISTYQKKGWTPFICSYKKFVKQTFFWVTIFSALIALLAIPVLKWIGKPIYIQYLSLFYLLLISSVIYVIGYIPHYGLYTIGKDKIIIVANIIGFLAFIVLGVLFTSYNLTGIAISFFIANAIIGIIKQWGFIKISRNPSIRNQLSNTRGAR